MNLDIAKNVTVDATVKVVRPGAQWLLPVQIEMIATGFSFCEGPVWHPDGFLLFSDVPANKIVKLTANGSIETFLDKSGGVSPEHPTLSHMIGSNGLAINRKKELIICQHASHSISCYDGKALSLITGKYESRPYNSPNDVVIGPWDELYFTDPPYGLKDEKLNREFFQPHAGIYRHDQDGTKLISAQLAYPNGLCISPDGQTLYASSNHKKEPAILKFAITRHLTKPAGMFLKQNSDGMTIDSRGNLFLATAEGLMVISSEGERLALIEIPEMITNMTWEGVSQNILYITAEKSIYKVSFGKT